jgi:RNA polymerase sigma factor for flagellar operon FliA
LAKSLGRGRDTDELLSAGMLGLVQAARSFDPHRDVKFATYAYLRIRGAVIDSLRGRPTVSCGALDEEQNEFYAVPPRAQSLSPDEQAEQNELLETLTRAILVLPKRDRHVLMLYYQEELTMKEIAAVLSLTESRVSQLHAAALLKLSLKLAA